MGEPNFYPAIQSPEDMEVLCDVVRQYGRVALLQNGVLTVGVEGLVYIKDLVPTLRER